MVRSHLFKLAAVDDTVVLKFSLVVWTHPAGSPRSAGGLLPLEVVVVKPLSYADADAATEPAAPQAAGHGRSAELGARTAVW